MRDKQCRNTLQTQKQCSNLWPAVNCQPSLLRGWLGKPSSPHSISDSLTDDLPPLPSQPRCISYSLQLNASKVNLKHRAIETPEPCRLLIFLALLNERIAFAAPNKTARKQTSTKHKSITSHKKQTVHALSWNETTEIKSLQNQKWAKQSALLVLETNKRIYNTHCVQQQIFSNTASTIVSKTRSEAEQNATNKQINVRICMQWYSV